MLSTPPAFVLSQDQTLYKSYLNDRSRSNLHRAICHSFNSFYSCCFRENWLTPYSPTTSWSLFRISSEKLSVWCFLFVTLFNLQGTRRIRRNITIIPNFISFVKNFFQKFFDWRSVRYRSNFLSLTHISELVNYFFQSFQSSSSVVFAASPQRRQLC